jgi:hypothetical protein
MSKLFFTTNMPIFLEIPFVCCTLFLKKITFIPKNIENELPKILGERGISQIWLKVKKESETFIESGLVLATHRNSLSKMWQLLTLFPQNMACVYSFFKNHVFNMHYTISFCGHNANIHHKKTLVGISLFSFAGYI